jgi:thiol-disulfide isomerase/thioredoxin
MSKFFFCLFVLIVVNAYSQPKQGMWRGALMINKEKVLEIPFNFEIKTVNGAVQLIIHNAEERIVVTETAFTKDSFNFKMPVFDTEFRAKLTNDTILTGLWINHTKKENNTMAFSAQYGNAGRFNIIRKKTTYDFRGKWEVTFSPNTPDSTKAIGIFNSSKESLTGTFLTETGDYRYLEGIEAYGKLYLSCFDGSHAFLFTAEHIGEEIVDGLFYSGNTWSEPWIGKRNEAFKLRDAEKLTYLKDPNQVIDFSFQNSSGQTVSLSDAKFKNKVVIVQVMGSWCPNCMDETAYLAKLYKKHGNRNFEVIGLAYERTSDPEKAKNNITRLKNRFGVEYEILITGLTGKDKASQSLPFLNGIMAFPTTLILDKDHKVVSVYTGFNGPATGKAYEEYIKKTEKLLGELTK